MHACTGLDTVQTHHELRVNAGLAPVSGTRPPTLGWNDNDGDITWVAQPRSGNSRAGRRIEQQKGHGSWSHTDLGSNPPLSLTSPVTRDDNLSQVVLKI